MMQDGVNGGNVTAVLTASVWRRPLGAACAVAGLLVSACDHRTGRQRIQQPRTIGDDVDDLHRLLEGGRCRRAVRHRRAELLGAPPLRAGLPLVVMTKTEPFPEFPESAGMTNDDIDAVWPEAQQRLVDLLPNTPRTRRPRQHPLHPGDRARRRHRRHPTGAGADPWRGLTGLDRLQDGAAADDGSTGIRPVGRAHCCRSTIGLAP